jgi:hypothetical protein
MGFSPEIAAVTSNRLCMSQRARNGACHHGLSGATELRCQTWLWKILHTHGSYIYIYPSIYILYIYNSVYIYIHITHVLYEKVIELNGFFLPCSSFNHFWKPSKTFLYTSAKHWEWMGMGEWDDCENMWK